MIPKKRTETVAGVTQLVGFVGTLVPTPEPVGRRIEVIGDSITCGFGVLGADQTCPFSPSTEAEPRAWGALASKELGAMHMATAVSGIGVVSVVRIAAAAPGAARQGRIDCSQKTTFPSRLATNDTPPSCEITIASEVGWSLTKR